MLSLHGATETQVQRVLLRYLVGREYNVSMLIYICFQREIIIKIFPSLTSILYHSESHMDLSL